MSQDAVLLVGRERRLWVTDSRLSQRTVGLIVDTFLPLVEPQSVNRPGSRLIQDPSDHGAASWIVGRRSSPYVVEDIDGQFFRGFPIADDAHHQSEHHPMRLGV